MHKFLPHVAPRAITFGSTGGSQITVNMDALFSTSLANYKKTLDDNISQSNAFFYELKKAGLWEGQGGSAYIAEDLLYELGQFDSYDGYDELQDTPTDGITQCQFEWRQGAIPISYSEKERKQNKHRIVNLIESKIMQAELGFKEGFAKALMQGALSQGAGLTPTDPYTSSYNGSYFIDSLPRMIYYTAVAGTWPSLTIGNLDQNTYTWWRNRCTISTATTYLAFLMECDHLMNLCTIGPGGSPTLGLCDLTTFELFNAAYYAKYQTQNSSDANYPFDNVKFRKAHLVWDENVINVYAGTTDTTSATGGTLYIIHPQFFKVVYEEETNFEKTPFQKPPRGDSRLAHILWMGQTTLRNRRKHGVLGKIARTLTVS